MLLTVTIIATQKILNLSGTFSARQVDGRVLLEIDDNFAKEVLLINHALKRRKLLLSIDKLKKFKKKNYEVNN